MAGSAKGLGQLHKRKLIEVRIGEREGCLREGWVRSRKSGKS
jgi:hypothetical protein